MKDRVPIPRKKIDEFKAGGSAYSEPYATEQIVNLIFEHFRGRGEITVFEGNGVNQLFRLGRDYLHPQHGVLGIHIHDKLFWIDPITRKARRNSQPEDLLKVDRSAKDLLTHENRDIILEILFTALEQGNYIVGMVD